MLFYDKFWQVNTVYTAGCAYSVLFIEDILKYVVEHIAADLCFKTRYTLVMACGRNRTTIYVAMLCYILK